MAPTRGCHQWLTARAERVAASRAAQATDRRAAEATRSPARGPAAAGRPAGRAVPRVPTARTRHPDAVVPAPALGAVVPREARRLAQGVAIGADHRARPNGVVPGDRLAHLPLAHLPEGDRGGGGRSIAPGSACAPSRETRPAATTTAPDAAAAPGPVSRGRRMGQVRGLAARRVLDLEAPSARGLAARLLPSALGRVVVRRAVNGPTRRGADRRAPADGSIREVRGRVGRLVRGRVGRPVHGVPTGPAAPTGRQGGERPAGPGDQRSANLTGIGSGLVPSHGPSGPGGSRPPISSRSARTRRSSPAADRSRRRSPRADPRSGSSSLPSVGRPSSGSSFTRRACGSRSSRSTAGR